jgi:hypothetical protein
MEKLTWQSGIIQTGFSISIVIAAIIASNFHYNDSNPLILGFMINVHLGGGIFGAIWCIILVKYLRESIILRYELKKRHNLRNFIGIKELLKNEGTRTTLFNFWLIMTGLMYLYYSTIIIAPDILHRDNIPNWTFLNASSMLSLGVQFALVSVIAHLSIPIITHFLWRNASIYKFILEHNIFYSIYRSIIKTLEYIKEGSPENKHSENKKFQYSKSTSEKPPGSSQSDSTNATNQSKEIDIENMDIENMDVRVMIFLGIVLVILSGIVAYSFYSDLPGKGPPIHTNSVILITMLVIFTGNAGFGLMPSMLASRFPIHLRNIGSSIAYNGGLVIGFASPFISMEFFLYVKNDYLLSIPIMLGALSIIIGAKRLLNTTKTTKKK